MGWQGGFLKCAGPYQLSHVLAGFPIPYLKSGWECFQDSYRHSQKEALTWQQSQRPTRPMPAQHSAEVQGGDFLATE